MAKNAAAYQTNLCAVKKIHKEKRGVDKINKMTPAIVNNRDSFLKKRVTKISKNNTSCIFIKSPNSLVLRSTILLEEMPRKLAHYEQYQNE